MRSTASAGMRLLNTLAQGCALIWGWGSGWGQSVLVETFTSHVRHEAAASPQPPTSKALPDYSHAHVPPPHHQACLRSTRRGHHHKSASGLGECSPSPDPPQPAPDLWELELGVIGVHRMDLLPGGGAQHLQGHPEDAGQT